MDATARRLSARVHHHATGTTPGSDPAGTDATAVAETNLRLQPDIAIGWSNAGGGDWSVKGNWSTGTVPDATSAVTIGMAGNYTVTVSTAEAASSLAMTDAGATLSLTSKLTILTSFSLTAGTLALNSGGVLAGGTLAIGSGGTVETLGGALSGVAVQGTLVESGQNTTLSLENGVTFAGIGGNGAGTINFYGGQYQNSYLDVIGSNTLSNATLNIGNGNYNGFDYLYNQHVNGGSTLTLGSSFTIVQVSTEAAIGGSDAANDAIVNNGTISAAYSGGVFQIDATDFTNNGSIVVSGGDVLALVGSISAALADSITVGTGGFVSINGVVSGGTLTAGAGHIGSIGESGTSIPSYGTLSGVAVQGTLVESGQNTTLSLENGVTFAGIGGNGAGTINFYGGQYQNSYLDVIGSNTLSNATLNIGNGNYNGFDYLYNQHVNGGSTLTLGSSFTIVQVSTEAAIGGSDAANDAIVNNGTISAAYSGGVFQIDATDFTNNGSIVVSGGDVLALVGSISAALADSITVGTGGFVSINGVVSGGTLTAGAGHIGSIGESGTSIPSYGTLSGVAVQGTLVESGQNTTLSLENGVTFAGIGGNGAGTINFYGGQYQNSYLDVIGSNTLSNATLNIGNGNYNGFDYLYNQHVNGGSTLTLGSSFTIVQVSTEAAIGGSDAANDAIVNNGTISAAYSGGVFQIDATDFTNNGSIVVSGGDVLALVGSISAALADSITVGTGGFVSINGVVSGGTLTAGAGHIGSIGESGTSIPSYGTLSGVAVQGTLVESGQNTTLSLENGVTFAGIGGNGAGTINFYGGQYQNSYLDVIGSNTLSNATLNIGNGNYNGFDYLYNQHVNGGSTLTLGSSFTIVQVSTEAAIGGSDAANDAIVNNGTISAAYSGGVFQIDATDFTNNGSIVVSGGDVVALVGSISATLADSITVGTGGFVSIDGVVSGGTLTAGAGTMGNVSSSGTLSGVAVQGTLVETGQNTTLTLENGVSFAGVGGNGAGTINFYGGQYQNSYLYMVGSSTLNNATLNIGNGNGSGFDYLYNDDTTGRGATLTLGASFSVVQAGVDAAISGSSGTRDAVINNGTILAGYSGGDFVINPNSFTNAGTIEVSNFDTLSLATSFTNFAAATLTGGTIVVGPNGTFQLGTGQKIVTLAANVTLSGTNSLLESANGILFDSTFATLATTGTLSLLAGRNFTAAGGILDQGDLVLGNTTLTAAAGLTLASTGTLGGFGTVTAAVIDNGLIAASGGALIIGGSMSGNGSLAAAAGATLDLTAGGTLNQLVTGGGTLQLDGSSVYTFTGLEDTVATVAIDTGATLSGTGYLAGTVADLGTLAAAGGTLQVLGGISGAGALTAAAGAVIDIAGGGSFVGSIGGAGSLQIDGAAAFVLRGAALQIAAVLVDAGATLDLTRGGALPGTVSGAGILQLDGITPYTLVGGTEAIGTLAVDSGAKFSGYGTLAGGLVDAGTVVASGLVLLIQGAVGGGGTLQVAGGATLDLAGGGALSQAISGAGTLLLDGATYSLAGGTIAVATLLVDAGATLSGYGSFGGAAADAGTVNAAGGTLVVTGALPGGGTLSASAGAVLDLTAGGALGGAAITGAGTLQLDAAGYTLAGGTVDIASLVVDAGASLSGYGSVSGAVGDAGAVTASGGTLVLAGGVTGAGGLSAGAGAVLDLSAASALTQAIGGAGTLQLDSATYTLAGGSIGVANVSVDAGASLSGRGSVSGAVADNGAIVASGGTLTLSGALSGTGALQANTGAVLSLTAGGTLGVAIGGGGTLDLSGAYALNGGTVGIAAVALASGASLSGAGTLTGTLANAGTAAAAGGTLALQGAVSGVGTLSAGAGAVLDLLGGGTFSGAIAGAGTVRVDSAVTLNAGASLAAGSVVDTANLALGAGESLTNLAGDGFAITAQGTVAVSGATGDKFTNAGSLVANGVGTANVNVAFVNSGNVTLGSGKMAFLGTVTNTGTIDAAAGVLSSKASVGGKGTLQIGATGTLSLLLGAAATQTVDFLASTGLLDLTKPIDFKGTIDGFGASDVIDLLKAPETSYGFAGGVLTVMDGTKTEASLHFGGSVDLSVTSDLHGGTFVTFV